MSIEAWACKGGTQEKSAEEFRVRCASWLGLRPAAAAESDEERRGAKASWALASSLSPREPERVRVVMLQMGQKRACLPIDFDRSAGRGVGSISESIDQSTGAQLAR